MKAILEYDLTDPDEARAHLRAVKSTNMAIVLFEMSANTKRKIENRIDVLDFKTPQAALDAVFEEFHALMEEQGIVIDDLIN